MEFGTTGAMSFATEERAFTVGVDTHSLDFIAGQAEKVRVPKPQLVKLGLEVDVVENFFLHLDYA